MKLITSIIASAFIAFASTGRVITNTNFENQQLRGFSQSEQQYQPQQQQPRPYLPQARRHQTQNIPQARPQQVQVIQARPEHLQAQVRPQLQQQPSREQAARILSYSNENNVHNYRYAYETDNGIRAQEAGQTINKGTQAQGEYSYTGDDGQTYSVSYTADEFGFRPSGNHLPTPPPVPEAIAKAIEQNAQEAANGIHDDGSYKEQLNQDNQLNGNYQQGENLQQTYKQGQHVQQNYQQAENLQQNYQQAENLQQNYQQAENLQQNYQQAENLQGTYQQDANYQLGNNYQLVQQSYQQPSQQNSYQFQPVQTAQNSEW